MHTLQRSIDEEGERDGVPGEVKSTDQRRGRVDVGYGKTSPAEDYVGKDRARGDVGKWQVAVVVVACDAEVKGENQQQGQQRREPTAGTVYVV